MKEHVKYVNDHADEIDELAEMKEAIMLETIEKVCKSDELNKQSFRIVFTNCYVWI